MPKYGLLTYKSRNKVFNIGDYIQSLSAEQFLDGDIEYICRERLDEYLGEKVNMIMNGWFMQESNHWPPSNQINPLYISFHLNSEAYEILNSDQSVGYFRKHEPIGCRDKRTVQLLVEKGINAYFSGCLTLTLGYKNGSRKRTENIYFIDPYFEIQRKPSFILKYLIVSLCDFKSIKKICLSMFKTFTTKTFIKTVAFYCDYKIVFDKELLKEAEYISHILNDSAFLSDKLKFDYAEALLSKYSTARLVVTSRIHCALPSLAYETPVIYIENKNQPETSSCRLDGIINLFHVINYNKGKMVFAFKFIQEKRISTTTSFLNKRDYLSLRNKLIQKCLDFTNH